MKIALCLWKQYVQNLLNHDTENSQKIYSNFEQWTHLKFGMYCSCMAFHKFSVAILKILLYAWPFHISWPKKLPKLRYFCHNLVVLSREWRKCNIFKASVMNFIMPYREGTFQILIPEVPSIFIVHCSNECTSDCEFSLSRYEGFAILYFRVNRV